MRNTQCAELKIGISDTKREMLIKRYISRINIKEEYYEGYPEDVLDELIDEVLDNLKIKLE